MKRKQLHTDWIRLSGRDINTLDIGAGTVTVTEEGKKARKYTLERVYRQLIRAAYERGLKVRPSWDGA